ncbi:sigma-70 family RNA polymerase sigma factor [Methylomonas sp. LL1]|uniref:RNA polymerase sigma factor n=1 Tax=Methylomonas sp. LL1 TaxID=2785785 RepID=UPI0018C41FA1|nr:sigma-70 family RNA polymerase sigma factor [Methylomonas sp. LL1]QPK65111.1 sigma-70 family RNA polymerase sigma factor [Methylomonas sp. LL1]CAG1020471.1 putative RNA polymerase sigma factor FecI [Methylococcales bacterium]
MINGLNTAECAALWSESLANDLRRFLTARLKCPETAADLTHETYLRLYQRGQENPPDNARALAFHIAMQLAIDYQRKAAVRSRYLVDDGIEAWVDITPAKSAGPEQILSQHQRMAMLRTALDELPPDCRSVFLMHGIEGLKYSEIGQRLGISISMVGKHLTRALTHCAQRLDQ